MLGWEPETGRRTAAMAAMVEALQLLLVLPGAGPNAAARLAP